MRRLGKIFSIVVLVLFAATAMTLAVGGRANTAFARLNSVWRGASNSFQITSSSERTGLRIRVFDEHGKPRQGLNVAIKNTSTHGTIRAVTGTDGSFKLGSLEAGDYSIRVDMPGFTARVITHPGTATEVVATLEPDPPFQNVTVDATRGALSTVIDRSYCSDIPLSGRSLSTLSDLVPGVLCQPTMVVHGQRPIVGAVQVDGVSGPFENTYSARAARRSSGGRWSEIAYYPWTAPRAQLRLVERNGEQPLLSRAQGDPHLIYAGYREPGVPNRWQGLVSTNMPNEMELYESRLVTVRLSSNGTPSQIGPRRLTTFHQRLTGASRMRVSFEVDNDAFEVVPLDPLDQSVTRGEDTDFRIRIKPKQTGKHQLTLALYDLDTTSPSHVLRYTFDILVTANYWKRFVQFVNNHWEFLLSSPLMALTLAFLLKGRNVLRKVWRRVRGRDERRKVGFSLLSVLRSYLAIDFSSLRGAPQRC